MNLQEAFETIESSLLDLANEGGDNHLAAQDATAMAQLRALLGTALSEDEAAGYARVDGLLHATLGEHTDWKHRAAQLQDALRATAQRAERLNVTNNLVARLCIAAGAPTGAEIIPFLEKRLGVKLPLATGVEA